ncbi:MAG: hypothetical protein Q7N50_14590 [Armatimonadota bacterium]|nr:hypothetical protein [Armatimonadota bacterium]
MLKRLILSVVVGAVVFVVFSPWGLHVAAFVASAVAGGVIGCVGGIIGELAYWLIRGMGRSGPVACVIHGLVAVVAGVCGLLVGGFLGYMSPLLTWSVVDHFHPEARFPGDMVVFPLMFLGSLLASVLALIYASGAMQSWLDRRDRKKE